jgi:hypothetical protein
VNDYIYGAGQEIYSFPIPHTLSGTTFAQASRQIYEQFGACLFAIGLDRRYTVNSRCTSFTVDQAYVEVQDFHARLNSFDQKYVNVFLNPGKNYTLTGKEIGFVICDESSLAEEIFLFPWNSPSSRDEWRISENTPLLSFEALDPDNEPDAEVGLMDTLFRGSSSESLGDKDQPKSPPDSKISRINLGKLKNWAKKGSAPLPAQAEASGLKVDTTSTAHASSVFKSWPSASALKGIQDLSAELKETPPASIDPKPPLIHTSSNVGVLQPMQEKLVPTSGDAKAQNITESMMDNVKDQAKQDVQILGDDTLPSHVRNHIVLCCNTFPRNLESFIAPMRSTTHGKQGANLLSGSSKPVTSGSGGSGSTSKDAKFLTVVPIVVLCPREKDDREWRRLVSKYAEIYYVKGSVVAKKDLVRARIEKAYRAVVLTDIGGQTSDDRATEKER